MKRRRTLLSNTGRRKNPFVLQGRHCGVGSFLQKTELSRGEGEQMPASCWRCAPPCAAISHNSGLPLLITNHPLWPPFGSYSHLVLRRGGPMLTTLCALAHRVELPEKRSQPYRCPYQFESQASQPDRPERASLESLHVTTSMAHLDSDAMSTTWSSAFAFWASAPSTGLLTLKLRTRSTLVTSAPMSLPMSASLHVVR